MCGQLHQKANSIMKKRLSFEEVTLLFSEPFVTKSSITKRSLNRRWSCMLVLVFLIHAYAVGRDMEEALAFVRKMKDEGIEMSLVTSSILVAGFAKVGNVWQK
ncbi:uncharacterized protein LOC114320255 isoform X1 [Camellia sinensis]|uniref:uncharacterized protein LOC114320255 isoform X1 n=1 Tax=Camellia sinensis TaxID=4442 RepID=UPI001035B094|nr:uncharacterized protein LOC114320255 isoform X1 [Camellia sinensis]